MIQCYIMTCYIIYYDTMFYYINCLLSWRIGPCLCFIITWNSAGDTVGHSTAIAVIYFFQFFSRQGIAMFLRLACNPLASL